MDADHVVYQSAEKFHLYLFTAEYYPQDASGLPEEYADRAWDIEFYRKERIPEVKEHPEELEEFGGGYRLMGVVEDLRDGELTSVAGPVELVKFRIMKMDDVFPEKAPRSWLEENGYKSLLDEVSALTEEGEEVYFMGSRYPLSERARRGEVKRHLEEILDHRGEFFGY